MEDLLGRALALNHYVLTRLNASPSLTLAGPCRRAASPVPCPHLFAPRTVTEGPPLCLSSISSADEETGAGRHMTLHKSIQLFMLLNFSSGPTKHNFSTSQWCPQYSCRGSGCLSSSLVAGLLG